MYKPADIDFNQIFHKVAMQVLKCVSATLVDKTNIEQIKLCSIALENEQSPVRKAKILVDFSAKAKARYTEALPGLLKQALRENFNSKMDEEKFTNDNSRWLVDYALDISKDVCVKPFVPAEKQKRANVNVLEAPQAKLEENASTIKSE